MSFITHYHRLPLTILTDNGSATANCDAPPIVNAIDITICSDDDYLVVLFDVENAPPSVQANFPTYSPLAIESVLRQDYLWQYTCYECFVSLSDMQNTPYLEINLATNGEFNSYLFDSYREPDQMPPRRVPSSQLTFGKDLNFFNQPAGCNLVFWQSAPPNLLKLVRQLVSTYPTSQTSDDDNCSRVGICLRQSALFGLLSTEPTKSAKFAINPCMVLQTGDNLYSYAAVNQANPPDFHDKKYWLTI